MRTEIARVISVRHIMRNEECSAPAGLTKVGSYANSGWFVTDNPASDYQMKVSISGCIAAGIECWVEEKLSLLGEVPEKRKHALARQNAPPGWFDKCCAI